MNRTSAGAAGMAALLLAASGAQAQNTAPAAAPGSDNVRCLIVGTIMSQSTDATMKAAAPLVSFYYLGRIDGSTPKLDLEKAMRDERPKVVAELATVGTACTKAFSVRFDALNAIGRAGRQTPAAPAKPPAP